MMLYQYFFAFLSGLLPALIWLFFWLREDRLHPEPKKIIIISFLAGMLVIPFVLPVEKFVYGAFASTTLVFILWAFIEELFKYIAAYFTGISRKCDDEPVDNLIYLISVALGFAALENTLFLSNYFIQGQITTALTSGTMRFIGSTLLHTVSSATIGIFLAFAFYHSRKYKILFTILGLISATIIHSIFNLVLVSKIGLQNMVAFYFVWVVVVFLIVFFEKVKKIQDPLIKK